MTKNITKEGFEKRGTLRVEVIKKGGLTFYHFCKRFNFYSNEQGKGSPLWIPAGNQNLFESVENFLQFHQIATHVVSMIPTNSENIYEITYNKYHYEISSEFVQYKEVYYEITREGQNRISKEQYEGIKRMAYHIEDYGNGLLRAYWEPKQEDLSSIIG